MVFWLYHCVEEKETKPLMKTTSKSDFRNVLTRRHTPTRWLFTRPDTRCTSHASSSPRWADPTRIPDDPTHVADPYKDDIIITSACTVAWPRMTSSWCNGDIIMHSQHAMSEPRQQVRPTCNVISREPSQVEPSLIGAEPRDRILCSRVYVQSDLRLNLSRSSGQNCFDQILAVWNAMWTISDLFPANLIVSNAMVRSDYWD